MAKAQYTGVNGVARKVIKEHVGVSGVARKVTDGYVGVNGIARKFFANGVYSAFRAGTDGPTIQEAHSDVYGDGWTATTGDVGTWYAGTRTQVKAGDVITLKYTVDIDGGSFAVYNPSGTIKYGHYTTSGTKTHTFTASAGGITIAVNGRNSTSALYIKEFTINGVSQIS